MPTSSLVVPLAVHIPGGLAIAPLAAVGILALIALGRDMQRLGHWMIVGGWAVFALTSPSSEFPTALRPISVGVVATGVLMHMLSTKSTSDTRRRGIPATTRLLGAYLILVLAGCLVSPYGATNAFRWVEGVAIIAGAFYGVSRGLTNELLVATLGSSTLNVFLAAASGKQETGVGVPSRLAGYMQANHLAFASAVVLIGVAWVYVRCRHALLHALLLVCAGVAVYTLLASRSRTGLIAFLVGFGVATWSWARSRGRRAELLVPLVSAVILLVPLVASAVSRSINRGASGSSNLFSLTGRTKFWPLVIHLIGQRPVLGWGVNVIEYPPIAARFHAITAGAVQAHNAFFEAALMAGIPGAVVWTLSLLGIMFGSLRLPQQNPYRLLLVALSFVLFTFSFTESGPAWFGDMFIIYALSAAIFGEAWKTRSGPALASSPLGPAIARSRDPVYGLGGAFKDLGGAEDPSSPPDGSG